MAKWSPTSITSACAPAAGDGKILLPKGSTVPKKRVLVKGNGEEIVLSPGLRAEEGGTAACVDAAALAKLGGDKARIEYRELSVFGVLRRNGKLRLQLAIAILGFVGVMFAAYAAWIKNSAEPAGFAQNTATIVFGIATVLACLKFWKELKEI